MGGFSTSTGSSSSNSPWAAPLGKFGLQQERTAQPITATLGAQYLEALRTGGVNSFIPWITRALDASRSSGSNSVEQLRQNLARSGFSGSSEGQAMLAEGEGQANQQTAMTPAEIIMHFISGAGDFAGNTANSGASALRSAGSLQNTTKTSSTPSFWDQFMQGVNSGGNLASGFNPPTTTFNFGP